MQYLANDLVKLFFYQHNLQIPDGPNHMNYKIAFEDRHEKLQALIQ
jgi:hypothetical protein